MWGLDDIPLRSVKFGLRNQLTFPCFWCKRKYQKVGVSWFRWTLMIAVGSCGTEVYLGGFFA